MRELGLGALQAWQALSEAQGRGRGNADVAILFTDLVGFSSWALEAGDETALELLRRVAEVEDAAISTNRGTLVKRLGDGSMSVFSAADDSVRAALADQSRVGEIEFAGHRPRLRAGIHLGRPRRVGDDYLGVDVNIAARVAESAKGGEVLVSQAARDRLPRTRSRSAAASGSPPQGRPRALDLPGHGPIMKPRIVRLNVRDAERVGDFYRETIGLRALGTDGPGPPHGRRRRDARGAGPFAERASAASKDHRPLPPRDPPPLQACPALALRRIAGSGWSLTGASDHLVSESLYLDDPEGNGIELYRDRPAEDWPRAGGEIKMATLPLDLERLAAEATEADDDEAGTPA